MTSAQAVALAHPCFLAGEMQHPRFMALHGRISLIVTVNAGYECRENGWGGPVWHASAAKQGALGPLPVWMAPELWDALERALTGAGVNDPSLEWRETGERAAHVRRRLRADEWGDRPWGMDLRNTREGYERLTPVRQLLPPGWMA